MAFFCKDEGKDKNDIIQEYISKNLTDIQKIKELEELGDSIDVSFYSYLDHAIEQVKQERKKIDVLIRRINPKLGNTKSLSI